MFTQKPIVTTNFQKENPKSGDQILKIDYGTLRVEANVCKTTPYNTENLCAGFIGKMVLEATIICIDNSEYVRNSDYHPTRLQV